MLLLSFFDLCLLVHLNSYGCVLSLAGSARSLHRRGYRAAVGLGSVFMHLKAEVNWYRIFHDLIENFETKKLNTRQKKLLKLVNL